MHIDDFNLCKTHYSACIWSQFFAIYQASCAIKKSIWISTQNAQFFVCSGFELAMPGWFQRIVTFFLLALLPWWICERQCMLMKVTFQSCKIVSNPIFAVIKSRGSWETQNWTIWKDSLFARRSVALSLFCVFLFTDFYAFPRHTVV